MKINSEKTQLMLINPNQERKITPILIDQTYIKHQQHIKILGITLSSDLNFDEHLVKGETNMVKKISSKIGLLRTIKPHLPQKAMGMIANNLDNSTIQYGAPIWSTTTQRNVDMIQKAQIKAARFILSVKWAKGKKKVHRQQMLDKLNWKNVQQLLDSASMNLVKRSLKGKSSYAINSMFSQATQRFPRGQITTSIIHNGNIQRKNTNFSALATQNFNSLPPELRDPKLTCTQFKTAFNLHIRTVRRLVQHW